MKRVLVCGGGYAGLAAARYLGRHGSDVCNCVLIDRRSASEALPVLPEIPARNVRPAGLRCDLARAARHGGYGFVCDEVVAIDPDTRTVIGRGGKHAYDALILATGAVTNYYGNEDAIAHAYPFRSTAHAVELTRALDRDPARPLVVCGGGYTGVELATAARRRARACGIERRIELVDLAPEPCATLPPVIRRYIAAHIDRLGIAFRGETTVDAADGRGLALTDGTRYPDALLAWSAGVHPGACVDGLEVERGPGRRLRVDAHLRLGRPEVFAAGDLAAFTHAGSELRMSVQFSRQEGRYAAINALAHLRGGEPTPFCPRDPGYLVPMAHNRACGDVLGRRIFGRVPMGLHFAMAVAFDYGGDNRMMLASDLLGSWAAWGHPGRI
ncbi:MAG: NAD(P)/FAD-dependent oxidoreductase [Planctomycetota bacterium]